MAATNENVWEVGDIVNCTATIASATGAAYDPDTVTFAMTEPDGAVTSVTPTHTTAGVWTVPWTVAKCGTHSYQYHVFTTNVVSRTVTKTFFVRMTAFSS